MTGADIRQLRERRGWSWAALAATAGVSVTTVKRAEAGKNVSPYLVSCIIAALEGRRIEPTPALVAPPAQASPRPRGFAAISKERQRHIASLGGRVAHQQGHAHEFDSAEARAAGRLGGLKVAQRGNMAELGRRGGRARWERKAMQHGA